MTKKTKADLEDALASSQAQVATLTEQLEKVKKDSETMRIATEREQGILQAKLTETQQNLDAVTADAAREMETLLKLSRFLIRISPVLEEKGLTLLSHMIKHMITDDMTLSQFVEEYSDDIVALFLTKQGPPTTPFEGIQLKPLSSGLDNIFRVKLIELGPKKINVIKIIRKFTGAGLKEAKELSESPAHTVIAQRLSRIQASNMVAELEDVGCAATMIRE